jgi:hypothetical protein
MRHLAVWPLKAPFIPKIDLILISFKGVGRAGALKFSVTDSGFGISASSWF